MIKSKVKSAIPLVKRNKYHYKKQQIISWEDQARRFKDYQDFFKFANENLTELEELLADKNAKLASAYRFKANSLKLIKNLVRDLVEYKRLFADSAIDLQELEDLVADKNSQLADFWEKKKDEFKQDGDNLQQRLDQSIQQNQTLRCQLVNEQWLVARFKKRALKAERQLRESETTLVGDEEDQPETSANSKKLDEQVQGWKSIFWQRTKKLGLVVLATYSGYQSGYYRGVNSNQVNQPRLIQRSLNPAQLINPIAYNQTHSWIENPLLTNAHCDLETPTQFLTFQNSSFAPPPLHEANLLNELKAQLRLRPNITLTEYRDLVGGQKPTGLPSNWKSELEKIPKLEAEVKSLNQNITELEKRPTLEKFEELKDKQQELDQSREQFTSLTKQLNQVKAESQSYQAQRDSRPDITLTNYQQLLADKDQTEKNLNNTQAEFEKYRNNTTQTITQKNFQITELQADLNNKFQAYNALNQTKLDLEEKLLAKSAKVETLNSLLDTLKNKYSQIKNKRDTYESDLTSAQQTIQKLEQASRRLEQEKNQTLTNLETFNQQLDNVQQELIRTQREKRKLAQKSQQEQDQRTKTRANFQEQQKQNNSYLQNILQCLASAGISAKLAWKAGKKYGKGELGIKYFESIQAVQVGIDTLIQQKKEALQSQARAEQERDQAQSEVGCLQQQIDNHHCVVNNGCSSYPSREANQTNSPAREQTKIIQRNNTQQIIQTLNTTLYLNLKNPTLNQVITEIQSRLAKDPITQRSFNYAFDTIREVEKEIIQQATPFGEKLETIKDLEIKSLEELLPESVLQETETQEIIQQIKRAQSYQQLVQVRNSFLAKHLAQTQKEKIKEIKSLTELKPLSLVKSNTEKTILISLLVVSLISIGGLLVKLRGNKRQSKY